MRTIVIQWRNRVKLPEGISFTLFYREDDVIRIDDVQKLKNAELIKYEDEKDWLGNHFLEIYKTACEKGKLKGDNKLIIVTDEKYSGFKLPEQVEIVKDLGDDKKDHPLLSNPPTGISCPELNVLWLIKDYLGSHTVLELEENLGMSETDIIKMQQGGKLKSKDNAEKTFSLKRGFLKKYADLFERLEALKKQKKLSNKDFAAKCGIPAASVNAFLRGKKDFTEEEKAKIEKVFPSSGAAKPKPKSSAARKKNAQKASDDDEAAMLKKMKELFPDQ